MVNKFMTTYALGCVWYMRQNRKGVTKLIIQRFIHHPALIKINVSCLAQDETKKIIWNLQNHMWFYTNGYKLEADDFFAT